MPATSANNAFASSVSSPCALASKSNGTDSVRNFADAASSTKVRARYHEHLARGPVLLLFFRGGWCPYCTLTLRAYEEIATEIRKAGGAILAISPQKASRAVLVQESNCISFPILVDCKNSVATEYGVLGQARPMTRQVFGKLGCNIPEENNAEDWMLPRAAEFLIDTDGIARMAHVSPVSYERTEPREALAALRGLTKAMVSA